MTKRENLADPKSCLNKAKDDEPLFILRANDPLAPKLVRLWASRHHSELTENGRIITNDQREDKAAEAMQVAARMESWKNRHPES